MRTVCLLAAALSLGVASFAVAAEPASDSPVEIPLETIWALDMPGTRDIEGIDLPSVPQRSFPGWGFDEFKQFRQDVIERLRNALSAKPSSEEALSGFVVSVPPKADLLGVLNLQVTAGLKGKASFGGRNAIPSDQDAYLIFYSHPASYYVRLKSVKRQGRTIDVEYFFEPHYTLESSVHFAMIPLGKLEAGEYEIRISQAPMDEKFIRAGFIRVTDFQAKRFVSRPFTFTVYDRPAPVTEEDPVAERIPLDHVWALHMNGTRDVRELASDAAANIRRSLTRQTGERAKAGPCFFVTGEGEESLRNAAKVLVDGVPPAKTLPVDKNVSLVFYSYAAPGYVVLHSVRHSDFRVTVRYKVLTHDSTNMSVHFALIPLGTLPAGRVEVEIVEVASETPYSNHNLTNRAVCDSCTIKIEEGT